MALAEHAEVLPVLPGALPDDDESPRWIYGNDRRVLDSGGVGVDLERAADRLGGGGERAGR